jgi:glycosyltransferase involved in cell wall biosynthesis
MDRSRVAIVIPALNEAATIGDVVRGASRHGVPWVVDDGSSDATAQAAREAGARVISHSRNQGYDQALNSGFAAAYATGCDALVTLDADGQHDPALLPYMLRILEDGADVVIGVRSKRARLAEHLFASVTRLRFGIRDPLCGMKAYRADVYASLGYFDSYRSIGTELALFAAARGLYVEQAPFKVRDRLDSPRFGRVWQANWRILRALALWLFRSVA